MAENTMRYVISIMAADRPGIVAAVSGAVCALSGNIVSLSQTVINDYFTIILIADFPEKTALETLKDNVEKSGAPGEFSVMARCYESAGASSELESAGAAQYMLCATGLDRKGIIYQISKTLGNKGINILDIATYLQGDQFVLVAQIIMPAGVDVRFLQDEIAAIGASHNIAVTLQHLDIFKETNRI